MNKQPYNKADHKLIGPKTKVTMAVLGLLVAGSVAIAATSPSPDPVTPVPTPYVVETPTPTATPAPTPVFTPEPPAVPQYRAICNDGSGSFSTGRGTCSWHGGVDHYTGN